MSVAGQRATLARRRWRAAAGAPPLARRRWRYMRIARYTALVRS
jgi:hypothetical protein